MTATIEFFPVHNGDMTLITLESGKTILIDVNVRKGADDQNDDEKEDVAQLLKDRLDRDANGRLYVDAFLLTHPDADHCRGLEKHFHLGAPDSWKAKDDKILIREMWSSPIIFRRKKDAADGKELYKDALAWWSEARRRVNLYKASKSIASTKDGDFIQILGEDKDDKTAGLEDILVKVDSNITKICGVPDHTFQAWLFTPHLLTKEEAEKLSGKNHSSTVVRFSIKADGKDAAATFLVGGDAEVENWDRVWTRNKNNPHRLSYDILLAPHHCSWRSLSYDSWTDSKDPKVDPDALQALSQANRNAIIIASSKEIIDDIDNPPCIGAKQEYEKIVNNVNGSFLCTTDECDGDVLLIEITANGHRRGSGNGSSLTARKRRMADKQGGGRYA